MITESRAGECDLLEQPGIVRALRHMLLTLLAGSLAVSAFTLLLGWPLVPWLSLLSALSALVAIVLSRQGWTRPGILFALTGIAYAVMHGAAMTDGIQSVGLATIPLLIVVGSLLLDSLKFAFFSATAILATAAMLALRYYVLKLEQYSTNDLGDFFIFSVTCVAAAVVGRLLSARIHEGFRLLGASERRYRRIFENIQDVYYEMQTDGALLELSPAGSALFGVPREEMIGRSIAPFCVDPSQFEAILAAVRRHGRVSNCEIVIRGPGATLVPLLLNATLQDASGSDREKVIGSVREITEWRRAEEALRDSEARLRLALEATGAGTFDFLPQSKNLAFSVMAKSHFGMPPDTQVDYDRFLNAIHPEDRERLQEASNAVATHANGGQLAIEYRIVGPEDGRARWIAVHGRMQFDGDGRPVRLIGTTLDISPRKRLEEDLRRRAEELQKIMDVAPVALFTSHDPDCREVSANRTGKAMLEVPEVAGGGNSIITGSAPPCPFFRDGSEIPVSQLPLQMASAGAEVRDCEIEARLSSGARRLLWGHASPLRDADGHVRGAIAAFQDVTETRRHTEALLRESEERFKNTADAAPVIIWFGDTAKRLVFVNEAMVRFTGLPAAQLLGMGWKQVVHPDDLEWASTTYFQSVDSRSSYQLEYRARRADGEYRHMHATTNPRYVGGEYAGQVGSVIDITDLKRRQDERLASQKLESVGMLASGIAHDFNNLLGSVLAQSELALAELAGGASPEEELRMIGSVARRGSEIVRQLMIYAGKEKETSNIVDVSATVREILGLLSLSVSKSAVLTTDLGVNLPPARADAVQIQQIVMNLVTNASEAVAERGGVIHVTTQCVEGPAKSSLLCIEVTDTGCGIAPDTQARIFDPFFSTKSAGRGLGLASVHGIVRGLQGTIDVTSEPGKGTTFRVLLPANLTAPAIHPPVPRTQAALKPSAGATILIVEDEPLFRDSVAKMLRKGGFFVIEAGDGSAALEALRAQQTPLDVLLLDITLPGASSRAVCEEARVLMPRIRVIATSAYGEDLATESLDGKLDFFIRKPYPFGDLVDMVRQALAQP